MCDELIEILERARRNAEAEGGDHLETGRSGPGLSLDSWRLDGSRLDGFPSRPMMREAGKHQEIGPGDNKDCERAKPG